MKEIVLNQKKIMFCYLKSYVVFDIIGIVPFNYIGVEFLGYNDRVILTARACTHFAKFVRLRTMLDYLKHITSMCRIKEITHDIICLILMTFYYTALVGVSNVYSTKDLLYN